MSATLKTDQGDRIKTAFESLKDFGTEGAVFFRENEVEIVGRVLIDVSDVRLVMPVSKILETGGSYDFNSVGSCELVVGISTKVASGAFKRFAPGDKVALGCERDKDRAFFVRCVNDGGRDFRSDQVSPTFEREMYISRKDLDAAIYTVSITVGSTAFSSMIGDLMTSEPPVIAFVCDGKKLKMIGAGLLSNTQVEIEGDFSDRPTATISESYATKHLQWIAKAKNMAPKITIKLAPECPARFEYDTTIGTLTFVLAARQADDIDDPRLKPPEVIVSKSNKRQKID